MGRDRNFLPLKLSKWRTVTNSKNFKESILRYIPPEMLSIGSGLRFYYIKASGTMSSHRVSLSVKGDDFSRVKCSFGKTFTRLFVRGVMITKDFWRGSSEHRKKGVLNSNPLDLL
jgi:hypothetical protein